MAPLNKEVAATVLIDAVYTTDEQACQKYGISTKTLQRYRKQLAGGDPELSSFVQMKKAAREAAWAEQLPGALAKALKTLGDCFDALQADAESLKRPDVIFTLTGAYKVCAEVYLTSRFMDARVSGTIDNLVRDTSNERNRLVMLDLASRIERRMKYLDRALPAPNPKNTAHLSTKELAELIRSRLPVLASRCCQQILRHTSSTDEFVCAAPSALDRGQLLSPLQKLLRLLELLNIAEWRSLAQKGEAAPVQEPHVYVFVGNRVYLEDAKGNRELQVNGNQVMHSEKT